MMARIFKILWDEESEQVISKLDRIGGIFLVGYIIIELGRRRIFGHRFTGDILSLICLTFMIGGLVGRYLTTLKQIRTILKKVKEKKESKEKKV
jgi:hypothetical protein